jgi:hypothetical protein
MILHVPYVSAPAYNGTAHSYAHCGKWRFHTKNVEIMSPDRTGMLRRIVISPMLVYSTPANLLVLNPLRTNRDFFFLRLNP